MSGVDPIARTLARGTAAQASRTNLITRLGAGLQRGRLNPVMTIGLPTVTSSDNVTAIVGGIEVDAAASPDSFTFLRANWVTGTGYPIELGRLPNAVQGVLTGISANGGTSPLVRFWSDAAEIEVINRVSSGGYRLRVDGEYTSAGLLANNAAGVFAVHTKFVWAAGRRLRLYEIEGVSSTWFGGVIVPPTSTVWAAPLPANEVRVIVHGDSFVELALPTYLGQLLGQVDTRGSGLGQTGFLNTGGAGRVKFLDRAQTDVIAPAPQLIVELGGINDCAAVGTNAALMQGPVAAWLDQVQAALPDALIVMTGPMWPNGTPTASALAVRDGKQAACAGRRNVVFVDNLAQGWVTGSGRVGAPSGSGIADWVTSSDTTHPTDDGALYLARRVARAVAGVV